MAKQPLQTLVRHLHQLVGPRDSGTTDGRDLLARFVKHRDSVAFATLLQRHGPMVRGVCRRMLRQESDVDDAFQATFLVLLRKAHTIRKRQSVGSWLYGVAYRIASRLRKQQASGIRSQESGVRQQESGVRSQGSEIGKLALKSSTSDPSMEAAWRELCAVLDAEVHALSEKLRAPLVLCYLESQTRDQAARQLGCPLRTLDRRLEQGRERLRARLARRGITLSAALLTTGLSQQISVAAVPQALVEQTIQAACGFAAGHAAGISPKAILLAEVALKGAVPMKLKVMAGVLLVVALAASGAALARQMLAAKPQAASDAKDSNPAVPGEKQAKDERAKPVRLDQFGDPVPTEALARIGTARFRHGDLIKFLTFSPDGKQLISQSDVVRVWETATGKELGHFTPMPVHPWPGNGIGAGSLSPDGKVLAVGGLNQQGHIVLLELATGRKLKEFGNGQYEVVTFSPDGKKLAAIASRRGRVELWDIATGQLLHAWDAHGQAYAVAFARDGKTLLTNGRDKRVCFWDVATGKQTGEIKDCPTVWNFQAPALQTALAPDGILLAAIRPREDNECMSINEIGIWSVATGKELRRLTAPKQEIAPGYWQGFRALAFAPDGKLVTSGPDANIRIWDPATGRELRHVPAGFAASISFALSPDGKRVAGGAETIRVIDLTDPRPQPVATPIYQLLAAADDVAINGELAVTANGNAAVWSAATGKQMHGLERQIAAVHLSPDGRTLFTSYGKTLGAWDTATGQELQTFDVKQTAVGTSWLALNPEGKLLLAVAGSDGVIDVVNALTGKTVRSLNGQQSYIYALAFGPKAQTLVACFEDRTMVVWDVATGKKLRQFSLPVDEINGVRGTPVFTAALSPDGKILAFGSQNRFLVLIDVVTGQDIRRLDKLPDGVCPLAFSPDGKTLAWAGWKDPAIHLVEVLTGQERCILHGHGGRVLKLAFSGDGKRMISASSDTTALIWELIAGLRMKDRSLTPDDLDACWADLAGDDATRAFQAIRRVAASPTEAIPYLRDQLKPVPAVDEKRLVRLIADLDSNQFAVRESATKELEKLGEIAALACRKALEQRPSAEARRRLEALIEKQNRDWQDPTSDHLRALRAVEVLEHIGSAEARDLLKSLAQGALEARLTQEAKASLERLAKQ